MKNIRLVLVLFAFTLACRSTHQATQVQVGTKEKEQRQTLREKTSEEKKTYSQQRKDKEHEAESVIQQKSRKEDIAQQTDSEAGKPSAPPKQKSDLMARLEGVRPATKEEVAAEEWLMDEISGLIIEQTMTKIGYDFYEYFFLHWEAPQMTGIQDYNIFINERASALWGSWIWISVNGITIWNKVLRPRSVEIEESAKQAIGITKQYLVNYQQYQFQSEDLIGTGI